MWSASVRIVEAEILELFKPRLDMVLGAELPSWVALIVIQDLFLLLCILVVDQSEAVVSLDNFKSVVCSTVIDECNSVLL